MIKREGFFSAKTFIRLPKTFQRTSWSFSSGSYFNRGSGGPEALE